MQGVNEEPTHKLDVVGNGRFRFLPDSIYIADSTVNKIVMVDSMGVLRWASFVPSQFGVDCADSVNGKLQFDTKVDLNNHNLYFTKNDSLGANHVGIGYPCTTTLPGKLSVIQYHPNTIPANTTGLHVLNGDIANQVNLTYTGIHAEANGLQDPYLRSNNVGGHFKASNANDNTAIIGEVTIPPGFTAPLFANNCAADLTVDGAGLNSQGVKILVQDAWASNAGIFASVKTNPGFTSLYNLGGDFNAFGATNDNFGLRSSASGGANAYGLYTSAGGAANSWAIWGNGNYYATGFWTPSDHDLKENIQDYTDASSILSQLHPKSYSFRTSEYPQLNLETAPQIGLISQELEQVLPNAVKNATSAAVYNEDGEIIHQAVTFKAVSYEKLIPILIGGHQEQQAKIDSMTTVLFEKDRAINELNARLTKLENCLQSMFPGMCQANSGMIQQNSPEMQQQLKNSISVNLSDKNAIVLDQNVPNPFAESTVITYSIPANIGKAQIHFYDASGKLIQSVEISERGAGQLNVFGNDLSKGIYTYTLVADGQVVSTKRMMKE